jgi:hypothetical protein
MPLFGWVAIACLSPLHMFCLIREMLALFRCYQIISDKGANCDTRLDFLLITEYFADNDIFSSSTSNNKSRSVLFVRVFILTIFTFQIPAFMYIWQILRRRIMLWIKQWQTSLYARKSFFERKHYIARRENESGFDRRTLYVRFWVELIIFCNWLFIKITICTVYACRKQTECSHWRIGIVLFLHNMPTYILYVY